MFPNPIISGSVFLENKSFLSWQSRGRDPTEGQAEKEDVAHPP